MGVKRPRRKTDYSTPTNSGVKNVWSYTSVPLPLRSAHNENFSNIPADVN